MQPLYTMQDRDFFCDARNIALAAMAVVIVYLLASGSPAGDLVWKANTAITLQVSLYHRSTASLAVNYLILNFYLPALQSSAAVHWFLFLTNSLPFISF
jgi:hypothetical protein